MFFFSHPQSKCSVSLITFERTQEWLLNGRFSWQGGLSENEEPFRGLGCSSLTRHTRTRAQEAGCNLEYQLSLHVLSKQLREKDKKKFTHANLEKLLVQIYRNQLLMLNQKSEWTLDCKRTEEIFTKTYLIALQLQQPFHQP